MRRVLAQCAALAASILVVVCLQQESSAENLNALKGRYAFTLAEKCVHQLGFGVPGFDSNLRLIDPAGAETYSGASDGFMIFDGEGNFSVEQGRATNIMNREVPIPFSRLIQPVFPPIPLGFGLGEAIAFTCTGTYSINDGRITIPVTCDASVPLPNVFGASGFESQFILEGFLPENKENLVLTDIGKPVPPNTAQPVTIFFPGPPPSSVKQQRICTRAVTLTRVSPK